MSRRYTVIPKHLPSNEARAAWHDYLQEKISHTHPSEQATMLAIVRESEEAFFAGWWAAAGYPD